MTQRVHDYHEGNRQLQDAFGTRRLADKMVERASDSISESDREYIESADMFFLATCDNNGLPTCSYKGGDPGFVRVVNDTTIAFPNYDGNGKYQSMGNALVNPNVGLLFIDFLNQSRLRLQGVASIEDNDDLLGEYPGAQFIVRVAVTEVYPNCPRYIHKYELVERSTYVPRDGRKPPDPAWKSNPEIKDVLPESEGNS